MAEESASVIPPGLDTVSAKHVYHVLYYEGPLKQPELAERARLPKKNLHRQLNELREADVLTETKVSAKEARYSVHK